MQMNVQRLGFHLSLSESENQGQRKSLKGKPGARRRPCRDLNVQRHGRLGEMSSFSTYQGSSWWGLAHFDWFGLLHL